MATRKPKAKKPRLRYVVVCKLTEFEQEVYGPYTTFKAAEGDAIAWEQRGQKYTVEVLKSPASHD